VHILDCTLRDGGQLLETFFEEDDPRWQPVWDFAAAVDAKQPDISWRVKLAISGKPIF
jgi:hypothetical protein